MTWSIYITRLSVKCGSISTGAASQIQITEATNQIIREDFICEPPGTVHVKGKGEMPVWYIVAEKRHHTDLRHIARLDKM